MLPFKERALVGSSRRELPGESVDCRRHAIPAVGGATALPPRSFSRVIFPSRKEFRGLRHREKAERSGSEVIQSRFLLVMSSLELLEGQARSLRVTIKFGRLAAA